MNDYCRKDIRIYRTNEQTKLQFRRLVTQLELWRQMMKEEFGWCALQLQLESRTTLKQGGGRRIYFRCESKTVALLLFHTIESCHTCCDDANNEYCNKETEQAVKIIINFVGEWRNFVSKRTFVSKNWNFLLTKTFPQSSTNGTMLVTLSHVLYLWWILYHAGVRGFSPHLCGNPPEYLSKLEAEYLYVGANSMSPSFHPWNTPPSSLSLLNWSNIRNSLQSCILISFRATMSSRCNR